jgi:hypothetical protein
VGFIVTDIKLTKEQITVNCAGNKTETLDGYSFTYEGIKFNVHKSLNQIEWNVTEYQTGMIFTKELTRKDALISFEYLFKKYGKEKIESNLQKNLERLKNLKAV